MLLTCVHVQLVSVTLYITDSFCRVLSAHSVKSLFNFAIQERESSYSNSYIFLFFGLKMLWTRITANMAKFLYNYTSHKNITCIAGYFRRSKYFLLYIYFANCLTYNTLGGENEPTNLVT